MTEVTKPTFTSKSNPGFSPLTPLGKLIRQRILELRAKDHLTTQKVLAQRLNISNNHLALLLHGKRNPSIHLLEKLIETLQLDREKTYIALSHSVNGQREAYNPQESTEQRATVGKALIYITDQTNPSETILELIEQLKLSEKDKREIIKGLLEL